LAKNVLGYILGDFFTDSPGHTGFESSWGAAVARKCENKQNQKIPGSLPSQGDSF
jgi:hypothetical protein